MAKQTRRPSAASSSSPDPMAKQTRRPSAASSSSPRQSGDTGKTAKSGESSKTLWLQVAALLLFFGARQYSKLVVDVDVSSCDLDQPLHDRTDDLFTEDERERLLQAVLRHPRLLDTTGKTTDEQQPLSGAFAGTRGFLMKFNLEGASQLAKRDEFRFLLPYYDAARDPRANAFVMNVLLVAPKGEADEAPSVELHRDDTVGVDSPRKFLAHSVSVYYLQVPEGMVGGALELHTSKEGTRADHVVYPHQGDYVVFRGDAWHRITRMTLGSGAGQAQDALRVSLVLEQYRLPPELYASTTVFNVNEAADHRSYGRQARQFAGMFKWASGGVLVALVVGSMLHRSR